MIYLVIKKTVNSNTLSRFIQVNIINQALLFKAKLKSHLTISI